MDATQMNAMLLRFFKEDIGGILVTGPAGEVLLEDEKTAFIQREKTSWKAACPPPRPGQTGEIWDLPRPGSKNAYMVITSTFMDGPDMIQVHQLVDTSLYMRLFQDMSSYSQTLKNEKERDGLTGLYNRGKFMEMKQSLFRRQATIAVFNMDLNDLKRTNDQLGHEAGDRLIQRAAQSLKRIECRNVIPFRMGGDEFMVIAMHVTREEAEQILRNWENGLREINRRESDTPCVIACGFAYGDVGHDLDAVLASADQRMYEDKKAKKNGAPVR